MALDTFTEVNGTTAGGKTTLLNYLNTLTPGGTAGITISSIGYQGGTASTSVFDSVVFSPTLSFGKGILLTSGDGTPNRTNTSGSNGTAFGVSDDGDPELTKFAKDAFPGAGTTQDASILTLNINVTDPTIKSIKFDVAFGSDEFPEYSNTSFVDIAAVWSNGVNYALINGQKDQPLSVTQKNVSLKNFIDNQSNTLNIEYDGLINKQSIFVPVNFGANVIKLGVADTGDSIYDSGLFILGLQSSTTAAFGTFQTVAGNPNTVAPEVLIGSINNDLFYGYGGIDMIYGYGGNDIVYGGLGGDVAVLLAGNDSFFGDDGNDYGYLGGGNDTASGGNGDDVLLGQDGNDMLMGDAGFNYLFGGNGNDSLYANGATSVTDVNVMFGDAGADVLVGGMGYNYFYGGTGVDTMYGGSGLNIFISSGETEGNYIFGGSGQNYVYGSNGGDTIKGGVNTDVFVLGTGNDFVNGNGGVDYAWGGGGNDMFEIDGSLAGSALIIQDFNAGDVVKFINSSITTFDLAVAAQYYNDGINTTVITDPNTGAAVWLIGLAPDQIDAGMFAFG